MMRTQVAPYSNQPTVHSGDVDSFVDESLIQRMMGDGRLAVKQEVKAMGAGLRYQRQERRVPPAPVEYEALGSWL